MKGDVYSCPVCKNTVKEADLPILEAICTRTGKCREKGGHSRMVKLEPQLNV